MSHEQEQPVFEAGDRFYLMRPYGATFTARELDAALLLKGDSSTSRSMDRYPVGSRGVVLDKDQVEDIWVEPAPPEVWLYKVRFDAFPAEEIVVFRLEEIAAKAVGTE